MHRQSKESRYKKVKGRLALAAFIGIAVVASSSILPFVACGQQTGKNQLPPLPKSGMGTQKNAMFAQHINQVSKKILGDKEGFWNKYTSIHLQRTVTANPAVKYPHIPITCGNSYIGILPPDMARDAASEVFAEWGIKLKNNVNLKGPGYEFVADGYNEELKIGFKIILPEGLVGFGGQKFAPVPAEHKLDPDELKAIDEQIKKGKLRLFVVNASGFPNMDADLYTPMEFFLASTVDYLNAVHGTPAIPENTVFGSVRKMYVPKQPNQ